MRRRPCAVSVRDSCINKVYFLEIVVSMCRYSLMNLIEPTSLQRYRFISFCISKSRRQTINRALKSARRVGPRPPHQAWAVATTCVEQEDEAPPLRPHVQYLPGDGSWCVYYGESIALVLIATPFSFGSVRDSCINTQLGGSPSNLRKLSPGRRCPRGRRAHQTRSLG